MSQPTICIIEDEPPIRRFLRTALTAQGYRVVESETGQQGIVDAATHHADLVILDLGLPDMDGVDVIRQIREWSGLPIVVLSARDQEQDKIDALDAGADDYLGKPFGAGELLARLRVALRRAARGDQTDQAELVCGDLKIDLVRRQVFRQDQEVHLTPLEYGLLAALARHAGKVLTHRHLLREVWGPSHVEQNHYLRIYMAQLRQKLEDDSANPRYLRTETGVGYRLLLDDCSRSG